MLSKTPSCIQSFHRKYSLAGVSRPSQTKRTELSTCCFWPVRFEDISPKSFRVRGCSKIYKITNLSGDMRASKGKREKKLERSKKRVGKREKEKRKMEAHFPQDIDEHGFREEYSALMFRNRDQSCLSRGKVPYFSNLTLLKMFNSPFWTQKSFVYHKNFFKLWPKRIHTQKDEQKKIIWKYEHPNNLLCCF